MIWRILKIILAAFLIFIVFNFLLTNFGPEALGYKIKFQFHIPPFLYLESTALPVGILVLISFCLGMIFAAFMGAVSLFYRSKEIKAKNRTIRELEKEIEELRSLYVNEQDKSPTSQPFSDRDDFSQL